MKTRSIILAGSIAATLTAHAQQPVLFYDFNSGSTLNLGTLGGSGTLQNATLDSIGSAPGFSGGDKLTLTGAGSAEDGGASLMFTGLGADVLGFTTDFYTSGAWVKIDSFGGDSMIFGQASGDRLHNGIRNDNPHLGHWGNDTTGSTNLNTMFGTGNWFRLDFRYRGDEQTIYVNGAPVARELRGNLPNAAPVVIGSSGNGGGLPGSLDDVVVYNSALRQNQIAYLAAGGNPNTLPAGANVLAWNAPYDNGVVAPSVQPAGPTAPGGTHFWGVREVRGNGGMGSIRAAFESLNNGGGSITNGFVDVINKADLIGPGNSPGGGGIFGNTVPYVQPNTPYLGDIAGDDTDVAFLYRARVKVTSAGNYTFGVHSDDGFGLRIGGFDWASVSGSGEIDYDDRRLLTFVGGTGDSNTRGTVFLPVGEHNIEFVTFEGGGGSGHELYYAAGSFANDGDTPHWQLLGGHQDSQRNMPGVTAAGWTVFTSEPGNGGVEITNNALAAAALMNTGTPSVHSSINFNDPGFGGPGSIGGDVPFPRDTVGVDDQDFAMFATATLQIDVADVYRFGFQGDDGGALRISGVSGWSIVENVTGQAYVSDQNGVPNASGDTLWADVLTGNSRTVGDIFLAAGTYTIESLFFERAGGAYWEVFAGDASFAVLDLLSASGNQNIAVTTVEIVPEPGSAVMLLGGLATLVGFQRMRRRK